MKISKLKNFTRGWFIGDFDPTLFKTKDFEVAVKEYVTGEKEASHYHKIATEYTVIVSGTFLINGKVCKKNDIICFEPSEVSNFACLKKGTTVVVKLPSVQGDKYIHE